MFKITRKLANQIEVMEELLRYNTVATSANAVEDKFYGRLIKLNDNGNLLDSYDNGKTWGEARVLPDVISDNAYLIREVHWYDKIPEEGVFCKVINNMTYQKEVLMLIKHYDKDKQVFIDILDNEWKIATPLTNEELSSFNKTVKAQ